MIDVVGMGVRSPFGKGPTRLLDGLCERTSKFRRYQPFVDAGLRYPFAAALPACCLEDSADPADRGTPLLASVVLDALIDASGTPDLCGLDVSAARVGLFVGTSSAGIGVLSRLMAGEDHTSDAARYGFGTEQVARQLGVRGPVQVVCSVCASGAQAIAEAALWLTSGGVDVAIAAGYDSLEPFVGAGFDALGAYADEPMPFRANRRGLVLGEGAAALVLARKDDHRFKVWGSVLGFGSASDAFHLTAPHPEGAGVAAAILGALSCAGLAPSDVDAINAHGTSTVYNDRMEARALTRVFGPCAGGLPVYTVKGTIGHTLGAAGAIEAVTSLVSMAHDRLPPTVTRGEPDPECDLDLVVATREQTVRTTLSISAGFGGVNCALLLGSGRTTP